MADSGRIQALADAAVVVHAGSDWMLAPSPARPIPPGQTASLFVTLHNDLETKPSLHLLILGPTSGGDL
jgi:hypothetical protein